MPAVTLKYGVFYDMFDFIIVAMAIFAMVKISTGSRRNREQTRSSAGTLQTELLLTKFAIFLKAEAEPHSGNDVVLEQRRGKLVDTTVTRVHTARCRESRRARARCSTSSDYKCKSRRCLRCSA